MDNYNHYTEDTCEEEYKQRQMVAKKRKKIILISLSLFLVLCLAIYLVFFVRYPLTYDELQLYVQEEDGIIYTYATWSTMGGFITGYRSTTPLYLDFEKDVDYREFHFQFSASRWELLRYPGTTRSIDKYYTNGAVVGSEGYVCHRDDEGILHNMDQRCGRLYYDNPNGTTVLLWECEDMPQ